MRIHFPVTRCRVTYKLNGTYKEDTITLTGTYKTRERTLSVVFKYMRNYYLDLGWTVAQFTDRVELLSLLDYKAGYVSIDIDSDYLLTKAFNQGEIEFSNIINLKTEG